MSAHRVTLKEIANACGLSVNSVSLALRNSSRISVSTRKRVHEAAAEFGYTRDPLISAGMARLRSLKAAPGSCIAVVEEMSRSDFAGAEARQGVYRGLRKQASTHGFTLETFHPFEDGIRLRRLRQILKARNVCGVILSLSTTDPNSGIQDLVRDFPVCGLAHRIGTPAVSTVGTDHFAAALGAVGKVLAMGYRRPGLIVYDNVDRVLEYRYFGGFMAGIHDLPAGGRVEPLRAAPAGRANPAGMRRQGSAWFAKHRPDVVLTNQIVPHPAAFLDLFGLPKGHPCVRINLPDGGTGWAGMVNQYERVGAAAIDQVVAQFHRGELGPRQHESVLSILPDWTDGKTCKPQRP